MQKCNVCWYFAGIFVWHFVACCSRPFPALASILPLLLLLLLTLLLRPEISPVNTSNMQNACFAIRPLGSCKYCRYMTMYICICNLPCIFNYVYVRVDCLSVLLSVCPPVRVSACPYVIRVFISSTLWWSVNASLHRFAGSAVALITILVSIILGSKDMLGLAPINAESNCQ